MTKTEFLATLSTELNKRNVPDAADIIGEYEQHFAFKLADGFSEKDICAKLEDPAVLAGQFAAGTDTAGHASHRAMAVIGLCFSDFFGGMFFALLMAWGILMAAFSIACGGLSICLLGGLNPFSLIPPMPYWCGAVFGVSFAALSVLIATGTVYFVVFLRQLLRSFGRFQHNALAKASGKAVLPELPIAAQLSARAGRRMRSVALLSLALFAACFVLGMIASMLSAEAFSFWHAWGWFGYIA